MHPPVLFAAFANAALLPWMAAASVPVIIHLLNKRKFRETRWAAMRFLLAAIRKNSRRIRLEQLLLLAVRTLLIILLVAAMARPFLENIGAIPAIVGVRTHRVLALDGSLSMDYAAGGSTRFDRAKEVAAQFVKEARKGDVISVVLMGEPPKDVIKEPSPNHDEVLKELAGIVLPHGGIDLAASLAKIDDVLDSSDIGQKEVIILTDLQATSWRKEKEGGEALRRALAKLSGPGRPQHPRSRPRSVVVDLGAPGGENVAITDIQVHAPIVTLGSSPLISATVRDFGRKGAGEVRVRFFVDQQAAYEQVLPIKPGEDQRVAFHHAFAAPGDHLVEARIDDDPLKLDNRRCLVVPVREFLNVLLVDGDAKSEPFSSETDYLAQALSPMEASPGTPSLIRTEVIPESHLSRQELAPYDVVVLANIAQFSEAEVAALEAYVKQGGGVVVFGGDQVVAENYNRLLFAEGKGLLPAEVGPPVGDARKGETRFGLDPLGYRHPIVAEFEGAPDAVQAGLTQVRVGQYHKLKLPRGTAARVALGFDTGDPAIVEAAPGPGRSSRGRVLQVATSADAGWTSWPLHPSYPPVMEQLVLEAASGRRAERNVRVGQPLDQALPAAGAGATAVVTLPDAKGVPTKLRAEGDVSRLHFAETDLSGSYQVRVGPPLAIDSLFAAVPDPAESDPAKLDGPALKAALPGWEFQYESDWRKLLKTVDSVGRRGELHRHLLYMVLALLIIESVLAWKFGHHR